MTEHTTDVNSKCTCGICIDGWLSARMSERLESEADFLQYASLQLADDLVADPDILGGGVLSEVFIGADTSLHYIPTALHDKMTPHFYHGYICVIQSILRILLTDPTSNSLPLPTLDAVTSYLANVDEEAKNGGNSNYKAAIQSELIHAYLDQGGKIEYALDAITHLAYEKSPIGSLYSRNNDTQEENAALEKEADDAELPTCENDLNFELVRTKLGLPVSWEGPHWFFLTDLSDSDEEDEGEEVLYEGVKDGEKSEEETSEEKIGPGKGKA